MAGACPRGGPVACPVPLGASQAWAGRLGGALPGGSPLGLSAWLPWSPSSPSLARRLPSTPAFAPWASFGVGRWHAPPVPRRSSPRLGAVFTLGECWKGSEWQRSLGGECGHGRLTVGVNAGPTTGSAVGRAWMSSKRGHTRSSPGSPGWSSFGRRPRERPRPRRHRCGCPVGTRAGHRGHPPLPLNALGPAVMVGLSFHLCAWAIPSVHVRACELASLRPFPPPMGWGVLQPRGSCPAFLWGCIHGYNP